MDKQRDATHVCIVHIPKQCSLITRIFLSLHLALQILTHHDQVGVHLTLYDSFLMPSENQILLVLRLPHLYTAVSVTLKKKFLYFLPLF